MSDIVDMANELAEMQRATALANRQAYEGESAIDCVTCYTPIPERRRVALPGVRRCVDCQQAEEQRGRGHR